MESSLKIALGIAAGALLIGLLGMPSLAQAGMMGGSGNGGMMGGAVSGNPFGNTGQGMMGGSGNGMMGSAISGNPFGGMGSMHQAMHGAGFDMNAMHRAMHGEDPDVDMNQMHQRMMAGNLTQEDIDEMREHCPMMRNWNATAE